MTQSVRSGIKLSLLSGKVGILLDDKAVDIGVHMQASERKAFCSSG